MLLISFKLILSRVKYAMIVSFSVFQIVASGIAMRMFNSISFSLNTGAYFMHNDTSCFNILSHKKAVSQGQTLLRRCINTKGNKYRNSMFAYFDEVNSNATYMNQSMIKTTKIKKISQIHVPQSCTSFCILMLLYPFFESYLDCK